jgi:hypothetical protein
MNKHLLADRFFLLLQVGDGKRPSLIHLQFEFLTIMPVVSSQAKKRFAYVAV